jgi:hypothetical protein
VDRSTQRAVVLTAVGIVALSLAAATLPSAVSTESVGSGGGNESESGFLPEAEPPDPASLGVGFPGWFATGVGTLSVVFALAYVLSEPKAALKNAVAVTVAAALAFLLLWALAEVIDALTGGRGAGAGLLGDPGASIRSGEFDPAALDPSLVIVGVVIGAVLLAALAALYSATGDATETEDDPQPPAEDGGAGVTGVGRAAGRAADRIEDDAGVDNEVYRAWQEMAARLDVDRPEASTPGEFADAAADAGMAEGDVAELTRLFEEVRYGDADATADREDRAVGTLRRIEDAYGGEGAEW